MQFVFCTQLFTKKHVHFTIPDDVMTLILFKFLYCCFYDRKKNTVIDLKISTHCCLFLQNAYKCSCSPRTYYAVEVVLEHLCMSRLMIKPTKWLRQAKTQIRLGIRPVWLESSLCVQWVLLAKDPRFLHADSEDSDQTDLSLRWGTCHFVGFCHEAAHIAMMDSLR